MSWIKPIAHVYTTNNAPGLVVLQWARMEPPFAGPWTKEMTKCRELIYKPSLDETHGVIVDAIARFNGDYEGKLGVDLATYIYNQIFIDD